ncbi:phage portal protein [Bacillus norwichensis]|uniref:Phage portal protein n=1 Tax=Bacillus norwichensis TaxID=2762217 RepID=A0ABR8VN00_9BACI|nr:phage portal protein [Bacillus norwichensis]MBD8005826.1 phage portal protein [Bacillus norwichensis]
MGFFDWMFGKKQTEPKTTTSYKIITDAGDGFYTFDGRIYKSDIVRSCIRPKARAIGKLMAKHIRENAKGLLVNPDVNIKFLLEEPNPLMSGQLFREKMATQLDLNNNAFAIIKRDPDTFIPYEIYPVPAMSVDMLEGPQGDMYLKFYFSDGKQMVVPYSDVIHLRQDFNNHNLFGDHPGQALVELMDVVTTIDQGMKKAIKSSALIKWILKFKSVLKKEDVEMQVDEFIDSYLNIEKKGGAVPSDPRYDLEQVKNYNFVPDDKQITTTTKRIYDFFNTNEKIVQSRYNEDEWNAYYESVIEPVALQLAGEFTRKLFTRRERGHGNKIVFESLNLQYASMRTKLGLVGMVDRGALLPNEWREVLNLAPVEGGDKPIRRLDTAEVDDHQDKGGEDDGKNGNKGTDDE